MLVAVVALAGLVGGGRSAGIQRDVQRECRDGEAMGDRDMCIVTICTR